MLRNRDMLALVGILILVRSAWNNGTESLSAAVDLAFFFSRERVIVLSPMDVDGDGTKEALAVVKAVPQKESFTLEIMDLKPLHGFRKTYLEPFRPKVIFTSEEINENNAHPIHLTTGQLLIKKRKSSSSINADEKEKNPDASNDQNENDRTRHHFCGTDWHDASSKCNTPCPNGQANECPDDERCFADTPCDALGNNELENQKNMFELTPGGGLPSVISLWSNGVVMLHSLTNTKREEESAQKREPLELREMWRYKIFPAEKSDDLANILWEEINVVFLDAYSSIETRAQHGMVVVSASYFPDGDPESDRSTFTVAVDAFKGTVLWESHSDVGLDTEEPLPLPMAKFDQTSFARRRSSIARHMMGVQSTTSSSALPNCMSLLKKAVKNEVFPYSYWGPKDAGVAAIHLNQKKKSTDNTNHRASKPHEEHVTAPNNHKTKKWHHKFHHRKKNNHQYGPIQGKPNALVTQTRGGLQIRSLKNGKALCHLALLEENLYSDLNNDGVLDQVQVALYTKTHKPNDKFIWNLASKLHLEHEQLKKIGAPKQELLESKPQLCHILVLSGIPAKEEMFSAPICGKVHERTRTINLDSVNPLVVESLGSRGNQHDIIVGLNNGMIHRIHGSKGRRIWALPGSQRSNNFPTWEEESKQNALLARIQSNQVTPPLRPLLLTGDNSLAVMSVTTGNILASATFPQKSSLSPILADLSGDGSTDVMVLTKDGIWGYRIVINRDFPVTQRILVGLLLMMLMLATIRNRYSKGGKRSTDE
jgi:hypothetical protein